MLEKDILEIMHASVSVVDNGVADDSINALLSVHWQFPRENVQSISAALPLYEVTKGFNQSFEDAPYVDRILFKEERRGTSTLNFELAVINDTNILKKIMSALIGVGVSGITNPYLGAGLSTIIKEQKIDEKGILSIGKGTLELKSTDRQGEKIIPLKTPGKIGYYKTEQNDSVFDDEDNEEFYYVIEPNTVIANVKILINSL